MGYTEVESGKRADRPELRKALAHAKRSRATLVIAKLDRLSRNVHFLSGLMESGVDFIACDNPHANKLTIHHHLPLPVPGGSAAAVKQRFLLFTEFAPGAAGRRFGDRILPRRGGSTPR
jgi:hypothetical protein